MNQINYKKSIKKQLLSMAMLMAMSLSASAQQLLPYQNTNLSVEARANDLLSRLTLEEKMKLMMIKFGKHLRTHNLLILSKILMRD